MKRFHVVYWIALFLLAACLSSCLPVREVDTDIRIKSDEKWTATIKLVIDSSARALIGDGSVLKQQIAQRYQVAGIEISSGRITTRSGGDMVYPLTLSGTGLSKLNNTLFAGHQVLTVDPQNKKRVTFRYNVGNDAYNLSSLGMVKQVYTLRGGSIVQTNGQKTGLGGVQWVNPQGEMYAVMNVGPDLTILFILIGVFVLLGLLILILSRRQQPARVPYRPQPSPYYPVANAWRPCPHCRHSLPSTAAFCPYCGKRI